MFRGGFGSRAQEETAEEGLEREAGAVSRERGSPIKEKGPNPVGHAAHSELWACLAAALSSQWLLLPRSMNTEHAGACGAGWKLPPAARDRPRQIASVARLSTRTLNSE